MFCWSEGAGTPCEAGENESLLEKAGVCTRKSVWSQCVAWEHRRQWQPGDLLGWTSLATRIQQSAVDHLVRGR